MDRDVIKQRIETVVGDWRDGSDGEPLTLEDNTRPVTGVSGFDSYSGIVVTIQLGAELGIEINSDNIFLTQDGKQARSVSEVIDAVIEMVTT